MDESDFEGSLVLERLSEMGMLDEFFEAIDTDNASQVRRILKIANMDNETIEMVLKKLKDGDDY